MMVTPTWINKGLFEDSLKNYLKKKSVEIKGYSAESAVPMGDNYTSYLYRASVTYSLVDENDDKENNMKNISVLVKSQPIDNGMLESLTTEMNLFPVEIKMFGEILPKINKILGKNGILSSDCLLTISKPQHLLILQDLRPLGFKMAPRQAGFDLDHCMMVMDKFAKLHAASIVLFEKEPILKEGIKNGIYFESVMIRQWMKTAFDAMIEATKKWPNSEKYGRKLEALGNEVVERALKSSEQNLEEFNVLNHGDCWSNNIMFTYDTNGHLKDAKFVDFQLVAYKSPVIDLHYFLATSTSKEVRTEHFDALLDTYYSHLLIELGKLKYPLESVPTRAEFQRTFEGRAWYGMAAAATILPLVRAGTRKDATFERFMSDNSPEGFRQHCYTNERYRGMIELQLKYFDDLGIFD